MPDPSDRSTQDPATDLLAPPSEAFADLLARTLAGLSPEPDTISASEPSPPPPPLSRRSLMHRILDRRFRRPPPEPVPVPASAADGDDVLLLEEDDGSAEEPAPVENDDDDALLLEEEVAPTGEPAPVGMGEDEIQRLLEEDVGSAEEQPAPVEDDDDDVLLLEEEVAPTGEPAPVGMGEDEIQRLLEEEACPSLAPAMEAIPVSLTPAAPTLGGDSRPGLLERLFSRRKPGSPSGEVIRYEPPPLAAPGAEIPEDEDGGEDVLVLDDALPAVEVAAVVPEAPPPVEPHTDVLLQQVLDALARQVTDAMPAAREENADQGSLLRQVLMALSAPTPAGCSPAPAPGPMSDPAPPVAAAVEEVAAEGDDDTLLLGDGFMVPPPAEPEPAPPAVAAVVEEVVAEGDDDTLLLDDGFMVPSPADIESSAAPETTVAPAPPSAPLTVEEMTALIAAATPDEAGTLDLPEYLDALGQLLLTPTDDFAAQDLLYQCWPRGSGNVSSRALLAVAVNLSRNFGLPGKLPMAASKAWRMLDPQVFQAALARRLAAIGDFVFAWQRSQYTFLSLEFGEIELIEYLFESLHPANNTELLASVMNFKVLSGRRIGLLRRIPVHARRVVEGLGPRGREPALVHLTQVRALLVRLAQPDGFPPIVEAAARALTEVEKMMALVATPPTPPLADGRGGGGLPLGRI